MGADRAGREGRGLADGPLPAAGASRPAETGAATSPGRLSVVAVSAARILLYANFMTVAACIPALRQDWHLGAAEAGSIVTSFTIGYALSLFGFGWLAERQGAKRAAVLSAVASAAASVAFGLFARDYASATALYALVGLAQGGSYTPLIMVFADNTPTERRGTAMGWLIASTSLGYALSLVLSGAALAVSGWPLAFLLTGLLPALGALALLWLLREARNIVHERPAGGGAVSLILRPGDARTLVAGYTLHSWELLGMWAWMPAFLAASLALGASGGAAATLSFGAISGGAFLSGVLHLAGASAAFSIGRLSDRIGRRKAMLLASSLSAVLSLVIGWLVALSPVLLVPLGLVYAFACIGDSPVLSTALTEAVPPGRLGSVLAVRSLLGFGAGAIAPLAVGGVLDLGAALDLGPAVRWGLAFLSLGLGGLAAAWFAARVGRNATTARVLRH